MDQPQDSRIRKPFQYSGISSAFIPYLPKDSLGTVRNFQLARQTKEIGGESSQKDWSVLAQIDEASYCPSVVNYLDEGDCQSPLSPYFIGQQCMDEDERYLNHFPNFLMDTLQTQTNPPQQAPQMHGDDISVHESNSSTMYLSAKDSLNIDQSATSFRDGRNSATLYLNSSPLPFSLATSFSAQPHEKCRLLEGRQELFLAAGQMYIDGVSNICSPSSSAKTSLTDQQNFEWAQE